MRTVVTEAGVMIPKELLGGVKEVDIRKENGLIVVIPLSQTDPILEFGKHPVTCGIADASQNPDKYLYNLPS